jgi:hypothetical protein
LILHTAAPLNRDTELSVIGVDSKGLPSISNFPKNFSSDGFRVWKLIFEDQWYKDLRRDLTDSSEVWFAVVQHYLKLCAKNGIFPFHKANQQTQNEVVASFLASSRRALVRFVDLHKVFEHVKLASVNREYHFRSTSFTLTCEALLKPIDDPTFPSWVSSYNGPRFKRGASPGLYNRNIQSNVDMYFKLANLSQPKIGFTIFCHTPIAVPEYSKLPSKAKLKSIAEQSIWLPVVRNNKFKGAGSRLF